MRRAIEKILAFFCVNLNRVQIDAHREKIVGYTKSGRAVYEKYENVKHKKFTKRDHYDALECHKKILDRLAMGNLQNEEMRFHRTQAHKHFLSSVR